MLMCKLNILTIALWTHNGLTRWCALWCSSSGGGGGGCSRSSRLCSWRGRRGYRGLRKGDSSLKLRKPELEAWWKRGHTCQNKGKVKCKWLMIKTDDNNQQLEWINIISYFLMISFMNLLHQSESLCITWSCIFNTLSLMVIGSNCTVALKTKPDNLYMISSKARIQHTLPWYRWHLSIALLPQTWSSLSLLPHTTLLLLPLLPEPLACCRHGQPQDIHPAGGTGLLALEPWPEAAAVEDVVAGKLLAGPSSPCTGFSSHHVLSADDADAVCGGKVFSSSIGVPGEVMHFTQN